MTLPGDAMPRHPKHGASCLGCGDANPVGLRLRFADDGHVVRARFSFPAALADANGHVAPGAALVALHEAMHHAGLARGLGPDLAGDGQTGLYAKGVRPGVETLVEAWPGRRSGTGYFWYARLVQDDEERANCETWLRPREPGDA